MTAGAAQRAPYEGLAAIYDFVMRHVDYAEWAAYIHALLRRFGPAPGSLADLACGTGNATFQFRALGYAVTGIDGAAAMLEVARRKARRAGCAIEFRRRDLRRLSGVGPFEAAVCLYDSFNYLLGPRDLERALEEIHAILLPGSLFVFDICTETNSLRYFADVRDAEQGPGFSYQRHSYYERERHLQFNHFIIEFEDWDEPLEETHTQRIYALDEVEAQVEASPFELLDSFEGYTFNQGSEAAERIHFVLRRPE